MDELTLAQRAALLRFPDDGGITSEEAGHAVRAAMGRPPSKHRGVGISGGLAMLGLLRAGLADCVRRQGGQRDHWVLTPKGRHVLGQPVTHDDPEWASP